MTGKGNQPIKRNALLTGASRSPDIADRLSIRERTVKFHVSSILAKLGAKNRTEAVRLARECELVTE
jgi:DNA-binding NarL/FixJ family response regulator